MRLGVPAYFYPWPASAWWDALATAPSGTVVVVNPASGPGHHPDDNYRRVTTRLRDRGVELLGYVDTAYGARAHADLHREAERYADWYGVQGVFLDQCAPDRGSLPWYDELTRPLRAAGVRVVLNHGQPQVAPGYAALCDALVPFEGDLASYQALGTPPLPGVATWHLVHGVLTAAAASVAVELARERGADLVWLSDGGLPNAWDALPPYWDDLLRLAQEG